MIWIHYKFFLFLFIYLFICFVVCLVGCLLFGYTINASFEMLKWYGCWAKTQQQQQRCLYGGKHWQQSGKKLKLAQCVCACVFVFFYLFYLVLFDKHKFMRTPLNGPPFILWTKPLPVWISNRKTHTHTHILYCVSIWVESERMLHATVFVLQ